MVKARESRSPISVLSVAPRAMKQQKSRPPLLAMMPANSEQDGDVVYGNEPRISSATGLAPLPEILIPAGSQCFWRSHASAARTGGNHRIGARLSRQRHARN